MTNRDADSKIVKDAIYHYADEHKVSEASLRTYTIGTDYVDRFIVSPELKKDLRDFVAAYRGDNRCSLAIRHESSGTIDPVFLIRKFHLVHEHLLNKKHHVYRQLREKGYLR